MAGRIAVMDHGVLQQVGAPRELYERPANLFVAGFIGSPPMNLLEVSVAGDARGLSLETEGLRLEMLPRRADPLLPFLGEKVVLGIRPEDIHLPGERSPGQELSAVKGEVVLTESMGRETQATLQCGGQKLLVRFFGPEAVRPGEGMEVLLDMGRVRTFDPRSGKAIAGSGAKKRRREDGS